MPSSVPIAHCLHRVLIAMDLPAGRIRRIAHRSNTHWRAATPHGPLVLRRYAPARSRSDVLFELQLLERLASRGWPVSVTIASPVDPADTLWCAFRYSQDACQRHAQLPVLSPRV